MIKISRNQRGFTAVEGLLIILILVVIGAVGYMVYHNNHKTKSATIVTTTTASSIKHNKSSLPASTITAGPTANWKTYTNNNLGFSFAFPDTSLNPTNCYQADTYDGNGPNDTVTGPETYRTSSGQVTNTVINDGANYYIAPTYTYMLTEGQVTTISGQSGYDVFGGCQKLNDTSSLIEQQVADNSQVNGTTNLDFSVFEMKAQVVKQGNALNAAVQSILGDKTLEVSKLTSGTENGSDKLSLNCSQQEQACGNIGGGYSLLYYPSKNLLVFWSLGQSCNLFASQSTSSACYDSRVVDSFKLTN